MLKYLALSICAHVLIVSVADIELPNNLSQTPTLKMNLTARAAPASQPVARQTEQASPVALGRVPVETHAVQKNVATETVSEKNPFAREAPASKRLKVSQATMIAGPVAASGPDRGKRLSTVIHRARYQRQTPPIYPRRALELGQEGTVTLHAEVAPTGRAHRLKVADSSGHRLLDHAALAAVRQWEFEPTRVDGNTVTGWVRVPVRFVIR